MADALAAFISAHGGKLELGVYMSMRRSKAAHAGGLLANRVLVDLITKHAPAAELHVTFLTKELEKHMLSFPKIHGHMTRQVWPGFMAERLITLLNHFRRVRQSSARMAEATNKLSASDKVEFEAWMSGHRAPQPSAPSRQLRQNPSAASSVSVDSQGFPLMLRDDAPLKVIDSKLIDTTVIDVKLMEDAKKRLTTTASEIENTPTILFDAEDHDMVPKHANAVDEHATHAIAKKLVKKKSPKKSLTAKSATKSATRSTTARDETCKARLYTTKATAKSYVQISQGEGKVLRATKIFEFRVRVCRFCS